MLKTMMQIFICTFAALTIAAITAVLCGAVHQLLMAAIAGAMCAILTADYKKEAKNEN